MDERILIDVGKKIALQDKKQRRRLHDEITKKER